MRQKADRDRILGHENEADGIQEYDNPLPDWWLGLFWITIIWGVAYLVHYHFIAHRSPEAALAQELAAAELRWAATQASETEAEFVLSAEAVAEGESIFQTYCVACHGANMLGGIGPNLLDDEWIHGGTSEDIVRIITDGVPEKGMVPWGPVLGSDQVNRVAAYVISRNAEALGRDPAEALRPPEGS
ncbi:MAG: c-type cytochrome [Gemmatimonadota bacterium]|nr:MAG: c-type cytochrome [Gemmatimonadota bacterium]